MGSEIYLVPILAFTNGGNHVEKLFNFRNIVITVP